MTKFSNDLNQVRAKAERIAAFAGALDAAVCAQVERAYTSIRAADQLSRQISEQSDAWLLNTIGPNGNYRTS